MSLTALVATLKHEYVFMLEIVFQLNTCEMMFSLGLPSPTRMKRRVEAAASNAQRSK